MSVTEIECEMRFAHSEGPCQISHTPDGSRVATAGRDGEVRMFKSFSDSTEDTSFLVGEECLALTMGRSKFYASSSGLMSVKAYDYETDNEMEVLTCAGDVTALDLSGDESLLAVGSEDTQVRLVDTQSYRWTSAEGHEAPLLSVALDPLKRFVISSGCDGSMRLWSIEDGNKVVLQKVWPHLFPSSINTLKSNVLAKMAWRPKDGAMFVAPAKKTLKVFERDTWVEETNLISSKLHEDEIFGCTAWSSGQRIGAGTTKGRVFIFDFKLQELLQVASTERQYPISDISWNPVRDELAFVDANGFWALTKLKTSKENIDSDKNKAQEVDAEGDGNGDDDEMRELDEDALANLLQEDDEEDENSFSIRKIKRDVGLLSENDDSNISSALTTRKTETDGATAKVKPVTDVTLTRPSSPAVYQPYIQESFQPSSTPAHLSSRFMCYNDVGIVMAFSNEEESSVDVEFHDASVHHPIHLNNSNMYTLADLSTKALVLASTRVYNDEDEDSVTTFKLLCHSFVSKEWTMELSNEEPIAVCCGHTFIALATDKRRLRLITMGGLQREVIALPGPVIALAAHESKLVMTVHSGLPIEGDQNIAFAILDNCGKSVVFRQNFASLPMTPQSKLLWLGFGDEGDAVTHDSAGIIRIWNEHYWTQIGDTKTNINKNDNYFLIGLSTKELMIRAILCKGSTYPSLLPKPTLSLVRMTAPLCEAVSERGFAESKLWLSSLQSQLQTTSLKSFQEKEDFEKDQDELMLQLFALYCRNDLEARALDLCQLMSLASLQTSIRFASKMGKRILASNLTAMATEKSEQEAKDEEERRQNTSQREQSVNLFSNDGGNNKNDDDDNDSEIIESSNPFLKVKRKRIIGEDQENKSNASFNPFKVAKTNRTSVKTSSRSGLTFDDMSTALGSSRKKSNREFGSANFDKNIKHVSSSKEKQTKLVLNKSNGRACGFKGEKQEKKELKGFQLWLAENKHKLADDHDTSSINMKGLEIWRGLSKAEKALYSTPRLPKAHKNGEDEENDDDLTQLQSHDDSLLEKYACQG